MTKEEYLKIATAQWEAIKELESETNFYDYEKKFDSIMVDFSKRLLNKETEGESKDRRQKKSQDPIRRDYYE